MRIIAIDPGATGCIIHGNEDGEIDVVKMPQTMADIHDALLNMRIQPPIDSLFAYIEKVGYHRKGNSASASAKFARHLGHIEMALTSHGVPFDYVTSHKWMRNFLNTVPHNKKERKHKIKETAQRLYPSLTVTMWNADGLGIYTWARRGAI